VRSESRVESVESVESSESSQSSQSSESIDRSHHPIPSKLSNRLHPVSLPRPADACCLLCKDNSQMIIRRGLCIVKPPRCWEPCSISDVVICRGTGSKRLFTSVSTSSIDTTSLSSQLRDKGYAPTTHRLLTPTACQCVRERITKLFAGEFDTGIYPDEWHWREGISRDDAAREMCNSWKSDRTIASIVLNEDVGRLVAEVMGWDSVRIAQDDLVWKPPSSAGATIAANKCQGQGRIDTVGFHQDSAYISAQFEPYEQNSITVWVALDDTDEENGCLEYAWINDVSRR